MSLSISIFSFIFSSMVKQKPSYKLQLIISISATLLAVTVVFVAVEMYTRSYVEKLNKGQYQILKEHGDEFKAALLGTSHVNYGNAIDQRDFFYYGQSGTFFIEMFYKLKKLSQYAPNLKIIVMEVDELQFTEKASKRRDKRYNYLYSQDSSAQNTPNSLNWKTDIYSIQGDIRPVIHKKFLSRFADSKITIDDQGREVTYYLGKRFINHDWLKFDSKERIRQTKGRLGVYDLNRDYPLPGDYMSYFEKSLQLVVENNWQIVFIRNAQANEYLDFMDKRLKNRIRGNIDLMRARYNIPILDYSEFYRERQEAFDNQDHIRPENWKRFSTMLIDDVYAVLRERDKNPSKSYRELDKFYLNGKVR